MGAPGFGGPIDTVDPRRPYTHLTVPRGWMNDPYGVCWLPDQQHYVLFAQVNLRSADFDPRMSWLRATSPHLGSWGPPEVVLEPDDVDHGCWSGTAVPTPDGLRLFYTGVAGDRCTATWAVGRIVEAGMGDTGRRRVLVEAPSAAVTDFRDPFLLRGPGAAWRMLVGGSLNGRGAVFGYSSDDLHAWRYDGVLARAQGGARVWECPQLILLDGAWVFIVSVGDDQPSPVVYSVVELAWPRLAIGRLRGLYDSRSPYATTTFVDRAGRAGVLSWLREPGPTAGAWAGVQSMATRVTRVGERVVVQPHPDVRRLYDRPLWTGSEGEVPATAHIRIEGRVGHPVLLRLGRLQVRLDPTLDLVVLEQAGVVLTRMPLALDRDGRADLHWFLDASVCELFSPVAAAPVRIEPVGPAVLTCDGPEVLLTCHTVSCDTVAGV